MRHLSMGLGVLALGLSLSLGGAPTLADVPSRNDKGSFLIYSLAVTPPRASTTRAGNPVSVGVHVYSGNDITGVLPVGSAAVRTNDLRLPAGFRVRTKAFAACTRARLSRRGPSACPRDSQVGTGTALFDVRPLLPQLTTASVQVFNGKDPRGRPVLLFWARSSYGVTSTVSASVRRSPAGEPIFFEDAGPEVPSGVLYSRVGYDLEIGRTKVSGGRRIGYLEAARSCKRFWSARVIETSHSGKGQTARARVPCVPA